MDSRGMKTTSASDSSTRPSGDKITSDAITQQERIQRKARKFAQLVLTKYSHLTPREVIIKARKLKKKYGFSDDDFAAFLNIALTNKSFNEKNMLNSSNTAMARTIGFNPMDTAQNKMKVDTAEYPILQDILKVHQLHMTLQQQVIVQSMTYQDCAQNVFSSYFDRTHDDIRHYIHPIVVALFFPRVRYLDEHMLLASISNIVATRHNNQPIRDKPTHELLYDMVTDPNEGVCLGDDKPSTMRELASRVNLQVELWKAVYNMRNGRFFPKDNNLLNVLATCKLNVFDSVDSMLVIDEGTILRRLLGVFSLRPTVVGVQSINNASGPFAFPVNTMAMNQVTTISTINLRLPAQRVAGAQIDFNSSLSMSDLYVENKMLVQKVKNVLYSRDVVFFYVNRRMQTIQYNRMVAPYNYNALPVTTVGFETLNNYKVQYTDILSIGSTNFTFKSVVCVETSNIPESNNPDAARVAGPRDFIVGNSTITKMDQYFVKYNPLKLNTLHTASGAVTGPPPRNPTGVPASTDAVMYRIGSGPAPTHIDELDANDDTFEMSYEEKGVVYMYCC